MKEITVIDDDVYIGDMLDEVLTKAGYKVSRAYSGTEAVLLLAEKTPDLILLDLMLPGLSGEDVLKKIRDIPVIVLSAKLDVSDKVNALIGGAADYITKPFDTDELLARIAVRFRDKTPCAAGTLAVDDVVLDASSHRVTAGGAEVRLTKTEYAVLKILMQRPTQVVTKTELLDGMETETPDCTESSLKVHVGNLRKKLKAVSDRDYIESVWGIGYKMKVD